MKNLTILILLLLAIIGCQKEKQEEASLQDMLLGRWNVISRTGISPNLTSTDLLSGLDKFIFDFDLDKSGKGKCLEIIHSPFIQNNNSYDYYVKFYDFSVDEDAKVLRLDNTTYTEVRILSISINENKLTLESSTKEGDFSDVIYIAERE